MFVYPLHDDGECPSAHSWSTVHLRTGYDFMDPIFVYNKFSDALKKGTV